VADPYRSGRAVGGPRNGRHLLRLRANSGKYYCQQSDSPEPGELVALARSEPVQSALTGLGAEGYSLTCCDLESVRVEVVGREGVDFSVVPPDFEELPPEIFGLLQKVDDVFSEVFQSRYRLSLNSKYEKVRY